jgi:hypothetical protein
MMTHSLDLWEGLLEKKQRLAKRLKGLSEMCSVVGYHFVPELLVLVLYLMMLLY